MKNNVGVRFLSVIMLIAATILSCMAQDSLKEGYHYEATIKTSMGNIVVKLFNDTPIHRDNFVKLINENFYENILFHRVIDGFVIQGGDPESKIPLALKLYGDTDVGYNLPAEIRPNHHHYIGALCAARENDETNPKRESSGSQFYIVVGREVNDSILQRAKDIIDLVGAPKLDTSVQSNYLKYGGLPHLDGSYTIYGVVIKGMENAYDISKVRTDANDRPTDDVYIKSITLKVVKD